MMSATRKCATGIPPLHSQMEPTGLNQQPSRPLPSSTAQPLLLFASPLNLEQSVAAFHFVHPASRQVSVPGEPSVTQLVCVQVDVSQSGLPAASIVPPP